jgi:hypothetical protein
MGQGFDGVAIYTCHGLGGYHGVHNCLLSRFDRGTPSARARDPDWAKAGAHTMNNQTNATRKFMGEVYTSFIASGSQ